MKKRVIKKYNKQVFCDRHSVIVNNKIYDMKTLTFSQVRVHYQTGQGYTISGSGRDAKHGYRRGCMTDIGDIEYSEWLELIKYMTARDHEEDLQRKLLYWVEENIAWGPNEKDQEDYALQLHASRIFDNPKWVDYVEFNKMYRPEVLKEDG